MLDFRQLSLAVGEHFYFDLWDRQRREETHFQGLRSWQKRLVTGDFLVLQRHFKIFQFGVTQNHRPLIFAQVFVPHDLRLPTTVGNLIASPDLDGASANFFWENLRARLIQILPEIELEKVIVGINGHMDLGLSIPSPATSESAFLTTAPARFQPNLFEPLTPLRTLKAFTTTVNRDLIDKVRSELRSCPEDFSTREIRFWNFRREMAKFADLVRRAMKDHPLYWPLNNEEVYDYMKDLRWILPASYFQFLLHKEREVGFCFALPDYNQILQGSQSDVSAVMRVFLQRRRVRRARIIYSAILPEYRGRKIFHVVRDRVIEAMIQDNVVEFESSYIDAENTNSLMNVQSTFARDAHEFYVYRLAPANEHTLESFH